MAAKLGRDDGGGGENQKPGHDGGGASPLPQSPNTVSLNGGSIGGTDGGWVPFVKLVRFIANKVTMTATAAVTGLQALQPRNRRRRHQNGAPRPTCLPAAQRANALVACAHAAAELRLDLRQRDLEKRGLRMVCNHFTFLLGVAATAAYHLPTPPLAARPIFSPTA